MDKKMLVTLAVVCGAVAIICVFLPWATGGGVSVNGTELDLKGVWVLILGAIGIAGATLVMLEKKDVIPLKEEVILFIASGLFGLAALLTLTDFLRDFYGASRGIGLILCLVGGIIATVTSVLAALKAKAA